MQCIALRHRSSAGEMWCRQPGEAHHICIPTVGTRRTELQSTRQRSSMFGVWHRAFPSVFVGETARSCPPLLGLLTIDKGIPLQASSRLIHLAPKLSVHARNIQQYTQHTCLCFIIPTKRAFFEFLWCVPYNSLSQGATGPKASFERMSKEN